MKKSNIVSAGLALFAMLFGAGNVFLPLALGRDSGLGIWYALTGFVLTAVLVPLLGIISAALYKGDYKKFLGTIGVVPGFLVALVCMVLLGPFGCTPRCLSVAYGAVEWYFPQISLLVFSIVAGVILFALTVRQSSLISILGRYLAPVKLLLLSAVILLGLIFPGHGYVTSMPNGAAFFRGFLDGYGTLDLIASIFFAGLICASLRNGADDDYTLAKRSAQAGAIGGLLLGLMYAGFCLVAHLYADQLQGLDKAVLLSAVASIILGAKGGILANITVALTCLTTAIALTVVFAEER